MSERGFEYAQDSDNSRSSETERMAVSERSAHGKERDSDFSSEVSGTSEASDMTSERSSVYINIPQVSDVSNDSMKSEISDDFIIDECIEVHQRPAVWTIVITFSAFAILIQAAIGIMYLVDPTAASTAFKLITSVFRIGKR
jgi:hypothetical protein